MLLRRRVSVIGAHTRGSLLRQVWASFWLIPSLLVLAALLLGGATIVLGAAGPRLSLGVVPGSAEGVRLLLSSIITAMISFTALVFSITVVALQLASSQFSPRVLRTFQADRVTQVTLGTFVGTFVYAMLAIAAVPDQEDGSRGGVAHLGPAVAMLLVLASIAVFILYIQHITSLIQVAHIAGAIAEQSRKLVDQIHPADGSGAPWPPVGATPDQILNAPSPGVVSDVAVEDLVRVARKHRCRIVLVPYVGQFVPAGGPLLAVHGEGQGPHDPVPPRDFTRWVALTQQPTLQQDLVFGFQQLADIAERALSPGYNDVTTAVQCVDQVHDLLRRLVTRPLRDRVGHDADGVPRLLLHRGGIERYMAVGVDGIAYAGRNQPRVAGRLTAMLDDLLSVADHDHDAPLRARRQALEDSRHDWSATQPA